MFNFYDFGRKGKQPPQYEFFIWNILVTGRNEWNDRDGSEMAPFASDHIIMIPKSTS